MKIKNSAYLLTLLLSSCGPTSDYVKIKLDPGLPNKSFPNLQKSLSTLSNKALDANHCYQRAFAGFSENASGGGFKVIDTLFTSLQFDGSTVIYPTNASDMINIGQIAVPSPIVLSVPRNKPIRVGMIGIFFASTVLDSEGTCIQNQLSEAYPFLSATKQFLVQDQDVVPIRLKMAKVSESVSQSSEQDFITFSIPSSGFSTPQCGSSACSLTFQYGETDIAKTITIKAISNSASLAAISITLPKMYPIKTIVNTLAGEVTGAICEKSGAYGPTDPNGADFTYDASTRALNAGDCILYPGDN